jgi:hypothetical protein
MERAAADGIRLAPGDWAIGPHPSAMRLGRARNETHRKHVGCRAARYALDLPGFIKIIFIQCRGELFARSGNSMNSIALSELWALSPSPLANGRPDQTIV